jgi:cytochrome c-type biogenesis protein CcmH/NrfF
LLEPRLSPHTILLWLVPGTILLAGAFWIALGFIRGKPPQPQTPQLSREEEKKLAELTGNPDDLTKL